MSVRALLVPANPHDSMRRITLHGDEERQVTQIQARVGGWLDMARVAVIPDDFDDPGGPETWIYAAVHDTGMLDGFPPNRRLRYCFEVDLYGDAVLTGARSTDGSSCDLPTMIEGHLKVELAENIEDDREGQR